jgi:2-dehydro-3-deoxyphosphogluconate aldolase/(4S)-4-hydroxy-2-oxoglutarate aldolase
MNFLQLVRSSAIVAIVRGSDADAATRTVLTLFDEGIEVVEVSLVTTDATRVIAVARAALGPGALLGAGTVITVEDAAAAAEAGASFVVTPGLGPGIAEAQDRGLPVVVGALTPTEIIEAMRRGADAIKLFPASLGGPDYLRALRDPFPDVPLVPVGGIDADLARDYLTAGAIGVGIGSPLVGDAASGGSMESLQARARMFVRALKPGAQS